MSVPLNGSEAYAGDRRNRWERKTDPEDLLTKEVGLDLIRRAARAKTKVKIVTLELTVAAILAVLIGMSAVVAFAAWAPG